MIITGGLDKLITFQKLSELVDEFGMPKKTWTDTFDTYANMYVRNKGMKNTGHSEIPTNSVEFKIRYRTGITYDHRIEYDGNYYKILFIEEMGRKAGLRIETEAVLETYIT